MTSVRNIWIKREELGKELGSGELRKAENIWKRSLFFNKLFSWNLIFALFTMCRWLECLTSSTYFLSLCSITRYATLFSHIFFPEQVFLYGFITLSFSHWLLWSIVLDTNPSSLVIVYCTLQFYIPFLFPYILYIRSPLSIYITIWSFISFVLIFQNNYKNISFVSLSMKMYRILLENT